MKKITKRLINIFIFCMMFIPSVCFADDILPNSWSNIATINGLVSGYYLELSPGITLSVDYIVQNEIPGKGSIVNESHITKQYVIYENEEYSLSDFVPTHPGKGELVTTWDNGHTEKDLFCFYTFVTVNYKDIKTGATISPMKHININKIQAYDMSEYDAIDIYDYDYVRTDGKLAGNSKNLNGRHDITVYYQRKNGVVDDNKNDDKRENNDDDKNDDDNVVDNDNKPIHKTMKSPVKTKAKISPKISNNKMNTHPNTSDENKLFPLVCTLLCTVATLIICSSRKL